MCHREIHDQDERRRETVVLYLRFLEDYVVFDFDVTSFFVCGRSDLMDLDSVTHRTEYRPQFINTPFVNLRIR